MFFYRTGLKINNNNCCKELFTSIKLRCSQNEREQYEHTNRQYNERYK